MSAPPAADLVPQVSYRAAARFEAALSRLEKMCVAYDYSSTGGVPRLKMENWLKEVRSRVRLNCMQYMHAFARFFRVTCQRVTILHTN